jgi:hypothetical protein
MQAWAVATFRKRSMQLAQLRERREKRDTLL